MSMSSLSMGRPGCSISHFMGIGNPGLGTLWSAAIVHLPVVTGSLLSMCILRWAGTDTYKGSFEHVQWAGVVTPKGSV